MRKIGRPAKDPSQKKKYERKLTKRLTSEDDIQDVLKTVCCQKKCIQQGISLEFIKQQREIFAGKSQTAQRQYLLDLIRLNNGLFVCGKPICSRGFRLIFNASKGRMSELTKMWKGNVLVVKREKQRKSQTVNHGMTVQYIRVWKQSQCKIMSDNQNFKAPVGFTISMLSKEINKSLPTKVHESTIRRILASEFPEIKFSKGQKTTKRRENNVIQTIQQDPVISSTPRNILSKNKDKN